MDCQTTINLMSRYIDDDLGAEEKNIWKKHMEDCKDCEIFFKGFQSSIELVDFLQEKSCPIEVQDNMEKMIVEMAKKKNQKK